MQRLSVIQWDYLISNTAVTLACISMSPEDTLVPLAPLAAATISMAMPVVRLCREDCGGLCPECGANRNHTDCGHEIINRRPGAFDGLAGLFEHDEEV